MSILIQGMEMPKSCWDCFISHAYFDGNEYWPWCESLGEVMYVDETEKHENCPLLEVPPHGRLIDADALMDVWNLNDAIKWGNKTAEQQAHSYNTMMMYEIANMIDCAPIIIPAERGEG